MAPQAGWLDGSPATDGPAAAGDASPYPLIKATGAISQPGAPAAARIVLLGETGAGKSTTANILCGHADGRGGAFAVVAGADSVTASVSTRFSRALSAHVTDTPGWGNVLARDPEESNDAYRQRCRRSDTEFFRAVSRELRQHGGTVLYVVSARARFGEAATCHLQAVQEVLGGLFSSAVALLLTQLDMCHQDEGDCAEFVASQRASIESKSGVTFAGALAVCDPAYPRDHAAHPARLVGRVAALLADGSAYLPPGVTADWEAFKRDNLQIAAFVDKQLTVAASKRRRAAQLRARYEKKACQLQHCDNAGAAGPAVGTVICVAAKALVAFFPPAGLLLGAVGAGATAVVSGAAAIAKKVYSTDMGALEEEAAALIKAAAALEAAAAARGGGRSAQELRAYVRRMEGLVQGRAL